jgi:UDPglucose--hexose-1-phosphate uridylyltransferase
MTSPVQRFDVTLGDWVAYPVQRGERPTAYPAPMSLRPTQPFDANCPFCRGRESESPGLIDAELDPQSKEWLVRVVTNKYPALVPSAPGERNGSGSFFTETGGRGVHEVVVESPDHSRPMAAQTPEHVLRILTVLRRRAVALASDPTLEIVQIFKNHGQRAGSSLPHPHFQIIGASVVPRQIRTKISMAAEHYHKRGRSLYEDMRNAELDDASRIILHNSEFVAFAPFASRTPYEVWILPKTNAPTYAQTEAEVLPALAEVLHSVLRRTHAALGDPPYNLTFAGAPRRHADEPDFVWHIQLMPRVSALAGFELATGMAINPILPETAAEKLRSAAQ